MSDWSATVTNLTNERKQELSEVMVCGNTLLKHWYEQVVKSRRENGDFVSRKGKKYSRSKFRQHLLKNFTGGSVVVLYGVKIPSEDAEKIRAVDDIQHEIVSGYAKLVLDIADKLLKLAPPSTVEKDELLSEGVIAILKASTYFTNPDGCFSTYAYYCIKSRLLKFLLRAHPMGIRSQKDNKLFAMYEEEKLKRNCPVTFDEIVISLGLNDKQRSALERMLVTVSNQSVFQLDGRERDAKNNENNLAQYVSLEGSAFGESGERGIGKTHYRATGRRRQVGAVYRRDETLEPDMMESVQTVALSPLETATLKGFIESRAGKKTGWKAAVARENGKSRMAITFAWRRVVAKILEVYSSPDMKKLLEDAA